MGKIRKEIKLEVLLKKAYSSLTGFVIKITRHRSPFLRLLMKKALHYMQKHREENPTSLSGHGGINLSSWKCVKGCRDQRIAVSSRLAWTIEE